MATIDGFEGVPDGVLITQVGTGVTAASMITLFGPGETPISLPLASYEAAVRKWMAFGAPAGV